MLGTHLWYIHFIKQLGYLVLATLIWNINIRDQVRLQLIVIDGEAKTSRVDSVFRW